MTEFQAGDILECVDIDGLGDARTFKAGDFRRVSPHPHPHKWLSLVGEGGTWEDRHFRLAFRPPAGEVWEPWNGGERPRGWTAAVMREGGKLYPGRGEPDWSTGRGGGIIIAYRIAPAEAAPAMVGGGAGGPGPSPARMFTFIVPPGVTHISARGGVLGSIDPTKIRVGDGVAIRRFVREVEGDLIWVGDEPEPSGAEMLMTVEVSEIVSHTPRAKPLEAGDKVALNDDSQYRGAEGVIAFMHPSGKAWVDWSTSMLGEVWPLSALTRAED